MGSENFKGIYPFSAVVGQEKLKKALLLNAINLRIGGVLIRGEKGTAKSTIVRALAEILPMRNIVKECSFRCSPEDFIICSACKEKIRNNDLKILNNKVQIVNLPLNATEDRLIGSLDMETAVQKGEKKLEPGILAQANGGILYVDEVNLLDDHLVEILLDVAVSGLNMVEREGISYTHPADFILIGTMNPEEGELRPQFLDRFGLVVDIEGLKDAENRIEILNRCYQYEKSPVLFNSKWLHDQEKLRNNILKAKKILPQVEITKELLILIAEVCLKAGVQGNRADIIMAQTAKALAALNLRKEVKAEDVSEAAELVLPHRLTEKQMEQLNEKDENDFSETESDELQEHSEIEKNTSKSKYEKDFNNEIQSEKKNQNSVADEIVFAIGEAFQVKHLKTKKDKILRKGSGRRSKTRTKEKTGRYVSSTLPRDNIYDLAFDATIRAAAPYQKRRNKKGLAFALEKTDIRCKNRKKSIGNTILFVVDASGSMGANERMVATKGAVLSLLTDAYQRRDRVGMVAFRKDSAELILTPTRSIDLAYKKLKELPTGGKTPLAKGLALGYEVLLAQLVKDPDIISTLVLITDGRTNVSVSGKDPLQEVFTIGKCIKASSINSIVIDTEKGFIRLGMAKKICDVLEGQYYGLEDIKADVLAERIKKALL